jgi:hypothetical protein
VNRNGSWIRLRKRMPRWPQTRETRILSEAVLGL